MPRAETEPLEDVLARLEAHYADDRQERLQEAFYNGSDGQTDGLNDSMLPCLVAICVIPRNEPDDFARIFRYFVDDTQTHKHIQAPRMVARLRAALFKATPLVGVVQVTNAMEAIHAEIKKHPQKDEILAALPKESQKRARTAEEDAKAGWEFFSAIYERHAQTIIDKIGESSPDLAEMIISELYGANLSRDDVMSWRETVLLEFTGWWVAFAVFLCLC